MHKPSGHDTPPVINRAVLMTGADHFRVLELNPYSRATIQPNPDIAAAEHNHIKAALIAAGVTVTTAPAPAHCPDGIYTANWGLVLGDLAILANLPGPRQAEQAAAERVLAGLGKRLLRPPYRFSGQGDALLVGPYLLCGTGYRTDLRLPAWLARHTDRQVVSLQTVPLRNATSQPVINALTGWPDSFFYDLDLALAIIRPDLIAWCPAAFDEPSQAKIRSLALNRIEVDYQEAIKSFACNLISTGSTVIMSNHAPKLQAALEAYGLVTITPTITELAKGGGYIRCITLTLDN